MLQAFGTAHEILDHILARGILNWGAPVTNIIEEGMVFAQQAKATDTSGKIVVLSR